MNAVGDATMALALFLLIQHTGQLDFAGVFAGAPHGGTIATLDRARPARRRGREVGADPAPHLAPRRDGGPDAGQRADPRRDDGHRRRLPARPHATRSSRTRERSPTSPPVLGAATLLMAGPDRARPDRHQARDRVLDDVADRLHVRRRGDRRLPAGDVPPDDARLLQGAALPRRRDRHPRARRRAGHPPHGRARAGAAVHEDRSSWSARSRSSASRPFAGFFSKDPIIAARSTTAARSATSSSPAASRARS